MSTHDSPITCVTLVLAAAVLAIAAPGCGGGAADNADDDYSESTWSALSAQDTGPAVLEDANKEEDASEPPAELDAADAPEEPNDADDEVESAAVASAPADPNDDGPTPASVELGILTAKPGAPTYKNAVFGNCADPGVIHVGSQFIAACTGGGYPTFTSPDLVTWTASGHIFNQANRPKWASMNWWAPEIHQVGARFVAYFAAFSPKRNKMCIGAAHATSASGPWTDLGRPLVCDSHVGLIDPSEHTDAQGRHFLYYKTDSNSLRPEEKTIIYGHQLGADGVSFVGTRHRLIKNTLGWEGDVVEAPWITSHGGYVYMFYSGFRYCNGSYGVGVARARSALGPFRKKGAPILHSNAGFAGPGHNSVVSANGHDFIVYAAWKGAHECSQGGNREMLVDRIAWQNGWPAINNGTPSRGRHTAPLAQ